MLAICGGVLPQNARDIESPLLRAHRTASCAGPCGNPMSGSTSCSGFVGSMPLPLPEPLLSSSPWEPLSAAQLAIASSSAIETTRITPGALRELRHPAMVPSHDILEQKFRGEWEISPHHAPATARRECSTARLTRRAGCCTAIVVMPASACSARRCRSAERVNRGVA